MIHRGIPDSSTRVDGWTYVTWCRTGLAALLSFMRDSRTLEIDFFKIEVFEYINAICNFSTGSELLSEHSN